MSTMSPGLGGVASPPSIPIPPPIPSSMFSPSSSGPALPVPLSYSAPTPQSHPNDSFNPLNGVGGQPSNPFSPRPTSERLVTPNLNPAVYPPPAGLDGLDGATTAADLARFRTAFTNDAETTTISSGNPGNPIGASIPMLQNASWTNFGIAAVKPGGGPVKDLCVKVHIRRSGKDAWSYLGRAFVTQDFAGQSSRVGE